MQRVALLASGGLDSTTLAYSLTEKGLDVLPIFVDYGQHCAETELTTLRQVLPPSIAACVVVLDLRSIYTECDSRMLQAVDLWEVDVQDDDLYVPYRNQILLTAGAAAASSRGINKLYSAFIQSNVALGADCTDAFLRSLSALTSHYGGVELHFPFAHMTKTQVAKLGIALNAPIGETFSCLASATTACGACPNCVDRLKALANLTTSTVSTTP